MCKRCAIGVYGAVLQGKKSSPATSDHAGKAFKWQNVNIHQPFVHCTKNEICNPESYSMSQNLSILILISHPVWQLLQVLTSGGNQLPQQSIGDVWTSPSVWQQWKAAVISNDNEWLDFLNRYRFHQPRALIDFWSDYWLINIDYQFLGLRSDPSHSLYIFLTYTWHSVPHT